MYRLRVLLLVVLLAGVVVLAACSGNAGAPESTSSAVLPGNLADATTAGVDNKNRGLEPGQMAPDFSMKFVDGQRFKLSDWRGQPVVLNFWATWCAPCKAEMPEFVNAYNAGRDDGLMIVGVNAQETADQASAFMQEYGIEFPVALDSRGDVQQLFQVRGLPTTIFIDKEGRVASRWAGLLTPELLQEHLAEIQ